MPRGVRKKSETGIYHVMLRGINRQNIFEDDEDREKLLQTLNNYKEKCGYKLYAYCLMSNHIHLLIKEDKEALDLIMKKIGASFVYWYNWKYKRSGHLFQDRFKSEPVENDSYFLTVLRYIHQNPVKAGLVKNVEDYKWSSYNDYINEDQITDTEFAFSLFSNEEHKKQAFIRFNNESNDDKGLEYVESDFRLTDAEATKIIQKICKVKFCSEIVHFEIKKRNKCIQKLKEAGISTRQISRLTGISRTAILKV